MIVLVRGKVGSVSCVRCSHMVAGLSAIEITVEAGDLIRHVVGVGEEGCSAVLSRNLPVELDTTVEWSDRTLPKQEICPRPLDPVSRTLFRPVLPYSPTYH